MLAKAEEMINRKECKKRVKYIREIKDFTDNKIDFRVKSKYIDLNIKNDIKYFNTSRAFQYKKEEQKDLKKVF